MLIKRGKYKTYDGEYILSDRRYYIIEFDDNIHNTFCHRDGVSNFFESNIWINERYVKEDELKIIAIFNDFDKCWDYYINLLISLRYTSRKI